MNWISGIVRKITKKTKHARMLNGYTPIFSRFGNDIYVSDVVQQAIRCIVREMIKITPMHIKADGEDVQPVKSSRSKVLKNPNQIMNKSSFMEKIMWLWIMDYNAWIIPTYDAWHDNNGVERRNYKALYPVRPAAVEYVEDENGVLYVKMRFVNGYETILPYADVIHLRYDFSVNEFMGGNEQGKPEYKALLKTLQINESMMNGVQRGMDASYAVNGVVKYNAILGGEEMKKALEEMEEHLRRGESGFLPMDIKGEYMPIKRDIKLVDADTLKFIDEKVLRWFGVSIPILTGDYTKEQYEAFYQKTLEPFVVQMSDEFTRVLFTDRERSFGNEIRFFPKNLIFMTMEQTLEMVRLLGDSGSLFENEKRVAFGLQPIEVLNGKRMQSLNYVNVDIADKYQMEKNGGGNGEKEGAGEEGKETV